MPTYIALLRAVNVGGTGELAMSRLKAICDELGFTGAETFIASGNVVFDSRAKPAQVKARLEARLAEELGKPVAVAIRSAAEMAAVRDANPFATAEPKHTAVYFLDAQPPRNALDEVTGRRDEEIVLGRREIFVNYPSGMGRSKLRVPAAAAGTARNMNTVAKLAEIASKR